MSQKVEQGRASAKFEQKNPCPIRTAERRRSRELRPLLDLNKWSLTSERIHLKKWLPGADYIGPCSGARQSGHEELLKLLRGTGQSQSELKGKLKLMVGIDANERSKSWLSRRESHREAREGCREATGKSAAQEGDGGHRGASGSRGVGVEKTTREVDSSVALGNWRSWLDVLGAKNPRC